MMAALLAHRPLAQGGNSNANAVPGHDTTIFAVDGVFPPAPVMTYDRGTTTWGDFDITDASTIMRGAGRARPDRRKEA